jgi:hypothetical protein
MVLQGITPYFPGKCDKNYRKDKSENLSVYKKDRVCQNLLFRISWPVNKNHMILNPGSFYKSVVLQVCCFVSCSFVSLFFWKSVLMKNGYYICP